VYGNATQAFADILLERRKELAFEGHRYIDLKRLGTDAGVTETDRFIQDSENASATNPYNISVTDYRFTLPIPQGEINVNPLVQNPNY
ncbi:MAG: RagB/SusD family nutrient uptake outer membrane protein, partial [Flavobacterium sp.]|nr:RagB/SusD family nutrient uptake outer membrane protein [Flavobacterium sp.]